MFLIDINPFSTISPTENTEFHTTIKIEQTSIDNQQIKSNIESQKIDLTMTPTNGQRLLNLLSEQQTPPNAKLIITTNSPDQNIHESHSPTPSIQQIESPYSTLKSSPTPLLILQQEEITIIQPTNYSVVKTVQAGITELPSSPPPPPPPQLQLNSPIREKSIKSSKKTPSVDSLIKIVNDHNERAQIYQTNEKQKEQTENVSYFRVAKSRYGKFETDNRGFVNNTTGIFDSTNNQKEQIIKPSEIILSTKQQTKSIPEEQHGQSQIIDTNYLKTNEKEKSPTPIQLEVTGRTTHISITVESDRKQSITRASLVQTNNSSGPPSILALKSFGKTITEYRTIKRLRRGGETTRTTITVRTETIPSNDIDNKQSISNDNDEQINSTSATTHESLMESIRRFGGSQNLNNK